MPSNEQRRQAAKRKLERQLARRAERAKRRRLIAVTVTVVAVVVVVGGIYLIATSGHGNSQAASPSSTNTPAQTSNGPCKYTSTPDQPAPSGKNVGLPQDPSSTPKTGTVQVTLQTNQGDIPLTLDRAEAACTVQSFVHLVTSKFYDNTPCHRLTADTTPAPLKVLQCGDPTGQGSGGPGYTIPDEKPKNLKPAPASGGEQGAVIYPAGTVAMAKTSQPNSGGSQFFLVYGDTYLPPDYTVFGTVGQTGMATLNKIAAGGIIPGQSATDGKPKIGVTIEKATIDQRS